jgi:hypothetical protein
MTIGLRASRVWFANTALENPAVTALTFVDGQNLIQNNARCANTLSRCFQLRC